MTAGLTPNCSEPITSFQFIFYFYTNNLVFEFIIIIYSVLEILKRHKKTQAISISRLRLGPAYQDNNLVFCDEDGSIFYPTTANRRFNKVRDKADLSNDVGIHTLRHTHATLLLKAGEHPKKVQERLGHASISETLDTYSHVSINMQKETAEKFDEIMLN
ncbi:MAG: tyrosine-type recombinase/integrase [Bacillota bacterium]